MGQAAVFFDRDNTLIHNDGYLGDPDQVALIDGAARAIATLRRLNYRIIIVSNQSGVARGLFTEDDVRAVNRKMSDLLLAVDPEAIIDRHEYCPFHPDATIAIYRQQSELRKPRPGMLYKAARALDIDLEKSWLIGDAPRDTQAGHAAGCRTILVNNPSIAASPHAAHQADTPPDYVVSSLDEAVKIIAASSGQGGKPQGGDPQDGQHDEQASADPPDAATTGNAATDSVTTSNPPAGRDHSQKPAEDNLSQLTSLVREILHEVKRSNTESHQDFSVGKLLAGISQILVLATLFYAYLQSSDSPTTTTNTLLLALTLQGLTIALLMMGPRR